MPEATTISPTALPSDDVLYEVIDGRIVEKPPMGAYESLFATKLAFWLSKYGGTEHLGQIAVEVLFKLDPASRWKRRPDVALVLFERWPRDRPVPREESWEAVPDLAIEVISSTNSAIDVLKKLDDYFRAGVRSVWVVYPEQRRLYVYHSPTEVRILGPDDMLDGEPVLPGVQLHLRTLFGDAPEAEGV
jgi:Uma2 family endonuclease